MSHKVIKKELKLCMNCMEEHVVQTVRVREKTTFLGVEVEFDAIYEYCKKSDSYLETNITENYESMKKAYNKISSSR